MLKLNLTRATQKDRLIISMEEYLRVGIVDQGGPIEKKSAYYHDEDNIFSGIVVILPNGFDRIPVPLLKKQNIRLNQRVNSIAYGGDGVIVSTNEKDFDADYVVYNVPLAVLKKNKI